MMCGLIQNIFYHLIDMRFGIGKRPIHPAMKIYREGIFVQPFRRARFYLFHQFRRGNSGMHADKQVCMIGIAINSIGFTLMVCNNAAHYFFQFIPKGFFNQIFPVFLPRKQIERIIGCRCLPFFIVNFTKMSGLRPYVDMSLFSSYEDGRANAPCFIIIFIHCYLPLPAETTPAVNLSCAISEFLFFDSGSLLNHLLMIVYLQFFLALFILIRRDKNLKS